MSQCKTYTVLEIVKRHINEVLNTFDRPFIKRAHIEYSNKRRAEENTARPDQSSPSKKVKEGGGKGKSKAGGGAKASTVFPGIEDGGSIISGSGGGSGDPFSLAK
jgi:hypothetical protein